MYYLYIGNSKISPKPFETPQKLKSGKLYHDGHVWISNCVEMFSKTRSEIHKIYPFDNLKTLANYI